jgi:hypothetical protein
MAFTPEVGGEKAVEKAVIVDNEEVHGEKRASAFYSSGCATITSQQPQLSPAAALLQLMLVEELPIS